MRADRAHLVGRGFSLLEALVVLALLALIVGVTAPAMGRFLAEDAERRRLVDLVNVLQAERTEAIRLGRGVRVALEHEGEALVVTRRGEAKRWASWGGHLLDGEDEEPVMRTELIFEPSGRTTTRQILFESVEASDRMWEIAFDPVSGVPSLRGRATGESKDAASPRRSSTR